METLNILSDVRSMPAREETGGGGGGKKRAHEFPSRGPLTWPPTWAAPPWPVWSDTEISKEPWDVGKVPKPPDPYELPVFEMGSYREKSRKSRKGSHFLDRKTKNKEKLGSSSLEEMVYIPFDDPLGPGVLPASLVPHVVQWVRGSDVPDVQLLSPLEEANFGRKARDPPDLASTVQHAIHLSPLLRFIIADIRSLYLMGRDNPLPLEATEDYIPEVKTPWRPWHYIYSLCEASNTQPPTPLLNLAGKYIVRLYFMGNWRRVTVDDRIPEDAQGRPLLPVLLPGSNSRASTSHSATSGGKPRSSLEVEGLRIWPAILCKALLRVASLSWREGPDDEECGEMAGFSAIACLTGWVVQRLDVRGIEPTVSWALLLKLMNPDATEPELKFFGYVTAEEEREAKRKAEAMLIPAKYNFPKKPRSPPPPVEFPQKDDGWGQPVEFTQTEVLHPAAVMAILREDLRTSPSSKEKATSQSPSFDWSWLDSDQSPSCAQSTKYQSNEDNEISTIDRETSEREAALPQTKLPDVIEHNALSPRWEHPVLLTAARCFSFDEGRDRPPTPLWQRHRWRAWAIARGLIAPERWRKEQRVRVFTPLLGLVQIPPPPPPLGPLHPPIPPLPLPLGYPFKYFPSVKKVHGDKHKDKNEVQEKENQKSEKSTPNEEKLHDKLPQGNNVSKNDNKIEKKRKTVKLVNEFRNTTEENGEEVNKYEEEGEVSEKDLLEPWVRFQTLQPEILALQVFYRPSTFSFKAHFTSLTPANVQTQAFTIGVETRPSAAKKTQGKGKETAKPPPEIYSNKLPMPPSEFGTEPIFFFIDAIHCKKVLFQLSIVSDDVLKDINAHLDANNPEKQLYANNINGWPKPYEHNTRTKNVSSGYLVAEEYRWNQDCLGKNGFSIKTNGSQSLLVNIDEGMAVFRLWIKAPRNFFLLVLSASEFSIGTRAPIHILMTKESASYVKCGDDLSTAYNNLLATVNKAPPIHRPPSYEDTEYKRNCLMGVKKGVHANALKSFCESILPPSMPRLSLEKLDRIWVKLIHRLEMALVSLLMEKLPPAEDCMLCINQWQMALQEPFFGMMTLYNYEEFGKPTNDENQWQMTKSKSVVSVRVHGDEGEIRRVSTLAAEILRRMGFEGHLVTKGHTGADECEEAQTNRPHSKASTPSYSRSKAQVRLSKGKEKKEKARDPSDAIVEIDPETGIEILKRMLIHRQDLLDLYPFRNDHHHRMFCTEYYGVTKITTHEWTPVVRCIVHPHQDHPVLCAIFAGVMNHPYPWVMVIDNETFQPVVTPSRFGSVGPFYAERSEMGYTVLIIMEVPIHLKEVSWTLRFAATKPDDVIHYCRPLPEDPPARSSAISVGDVNAPSGERKSAIGEQHPLEGESVHQLPGKSVADKKSFAGKKRALPLTNSGDCLGPQQPPQLAVLELRGLYTAPSDGVVACGLLRLPMNPPWFPTLPLSLHVRLSSSKAKFRFTMENVETGEILIDTTGTGHKTIPVYFLKVPPPTDEEHPPKRKVTTTGVSEIMLMAAVAGMRVGPVFRSPSFYASEDSIVDVTCSLRLTVRVKPGEWPLTPAEFDSVTRAKQEEMKKGMLYGDEREVVTANHTTVTSITSVTNPITLTPAPSVVNKKKNPSHSITSTNVTMAPETDGPSYLLVVVVDSDRTSRAELISDIPRAVTLRLLKEQSEERHPGRHLLAEEARRLFLLRREEGKRIMESHLMAEDQIGLALEQGRTIDVMNSGKDIFRPMSAPMQGGMVQGGMMSPSTPIRASAPASTGKDLSQEMLGLRPIVRTQEDMLNEMTQNAYNRSMISSPFNPVHVTPEDVQERLEALISVKVEENRVSEELFDSLEQLRSTQDHVAQLALSTISDFEAQALGVYKAAQEFREKTIGEVKKSKKSKNWTSSSVGSLGSRHSVFRSPRKSNKH